MSVASYVGVVPAQLSPLRVDSARAAAESGGEDPFAQLEAALARAPRVHPDTAAATGLPAGLRGGYVGYFGYEARAAMGLEHGHPVPGYLPAHEAPTPDSLWLPAVRYLVHEHARPGAAARSWLVGDESWCEAAERLLSAAGERASEIASDSTPVNTPELTELLLFPAPAAEAYMDSVRASQHEIYEGNTYEVCLTAQTNARKTLAAGFTTVRDLGGDPRHERPPRDRHRRHEAGCPDRRRATLPRRRDAGSAVADDPQ